MVPRARDFLLSIAKHCTFPSLGGVLVAVFATSGFFADTAGISEVRAQDVSTPPTVGYLNATNGFGSLSYLCNSQAQIDTIKCNFVQILITKPELDSVNDQVASELASTATGDFCKQLVDLPRMLELGVKADGSPMDKETLHSLEGKRETLQKWAAFCENKNTENAKILLHSINRDKSVTCTISSHTFDLTFTYNFNTNRWEGISGPNGPCGVVKHYAFQRDISSSFAFWNYSQRSLVTNREGAIGTSSCNVWKEEELHYTWKAREIRPMCEFVGFGGY